jgi:hypothetical protein
MKVPGYEQGQGQGQKEKKRRRYKGSGNRKDMHTFHPAHVPILLVHTRFWYDNKQKFTVSLQKNKLNHWTTQKCHMIVLGL